MVILNCPFCDSEINTIHTKGTYGYDLHYYITCPVCPAYMHGTYEKGKQALVNKWNLRKGL